mmetsp:Transcript_23243/g.23452  ORF Transcript_23243/g.23452 Transcript_23243/m.23452 type:complete len:223 (+) Transcript_23243:2584-3252(+)
MNTSTRRGVFLIVMSSRDVSDAFERLQRLQLKGKQDRDVVRVIIECCGHERTYNEFYAQLLSLFCESNRQFKITIQFVFWDLFNGMNSSSKVQSKQNDRKVVNQSRLLAHLVCNFHLSLSILKPVDMSDAEGELLLFLATFFMAVFSYKISNEDYLKVLDRVATTSDFAIVRDNILVFLQTHLTVIPDGLDATETRKMRQRRKQTLRTMEAMNVLDMVRQHD